MLHLFPGQGIQKVGMLRELLSKNPQLNPLYNKYVKIVENLQLYMEEGPQEMLNRTEFAQPAIFIHSYLHFLQRHPKQVEGYCIGHSVGEYTALTVAGAFKPEETIGLLYQRGCIMRDSSQGRLMGMLAIHSSGDQLHKISNELQQSWPQFILEPALYNSPKQTVYSGDQDILKLFQTELQKIKIRSSFLQVSAAFHCSLLTQGKDKLRNCLNNINIMSLNDELRVIRNLDAKIYETREDILEGLTNQLDHPVQFVKSVQEARKFTSEAVEEYGSNVLKPLISQI